jgi:hypothetical protein
MKRGPRPPKAKVAHMEGKLCWSPEIAEKVQLEVKNVTSERK